jgi:predicted nucleotide-binding protein
MTRPYVSANPLQLDEEINEITGRIQILWNERNFVESERLFQSYYERMRHYEQLLPEGFRLHKGTPLHNWGVTILLQQNPERTSEAVYRFFLAYIEDLLDFDNIQQVMAAPAYKTLITSSLPASAIRLAQTIVEQLQNANTIPKNPEEVLNAQLREALRFVNQQVDTNKRKTVFVVHGRNLKARDSMYTFLRSLDLNPINLTETIAQSGQVMPYIGEVLDYAFSLAQAVVVLMTPDDLGCLRRQFREAGDPPQDITFTPQARLNVVFEAGMAMGGNFRKRTILVELGRLRQLTDWGGLFEVRLTNNVNRRQDLITRLRNCQCIVNDSNNTWQTAGDFESVIINKEGVFRRLMLSCL